MPLFCLLLDWTQLRKKISELEDSSVATTKTQKSKENKREKKNKISKNCETTTKGEAYV